MGVTDTKDGGASRRTQLQHKHPTELVSEARRVRSSDESGEKLRLTTDAEQRAFVSEVRKENNEGFGPPARKAVQKLLLAGLPHPWMYVYELTQNARDAGAERVAWRTNGNTVLFQHDGNMALDESHVRGIASLGASTKGLAAVGFMGVGFKSVFARFRVARVSGFGWHFRFDVGTRHGDIDSTVTEWFDTLLPHWDEEGVTPDEGYTTAFLLECPADAARPIEEDLERIASPKDPTPLAVLALRGLKQVHVGDVSWDLGVQDGVVVVRSSQSEAAWRWKSFTSSYRPNDDAMRRFLEIRQELQDHVDEDGQRIEREVVALLPLNEEGRPEPPDHGRVYATLPTQVQVPLGFHLQADWLVNVDRQNLREVSGDPWQKAILEQVPELVCQFLVWLSEEPETARKVGYSALRDPGTDDGLLSKHFQELQEDLVTVLRGLPIVPIYGEGPRQFCIPECVARLPGKFLSSFGKHPGWRPDLLFGHDLMDEILLGRQATGFARWLGWGRGLQLDDLQWPETLQRWWSALPKEQRIDALFALWDGVGEREWNEAPVVPTEAGAWVPAGETRWLNEEPPTEKEPSGGRIADALSSVLPGPNERLPAGIRQRVMKSDGSGPGWLEEQQQNVKLASLIESACSASEAKEELPLVELVEWALSRNDRRQDLVPLVLTEDGARGPRESLLAEPMVEGGWSRRLLFPDKSALVEDYAIIEDLQAVVLFLERLGVWGRGALKEGRTRISRHNKQRVADLLGIDVQAVEPSNNSGYTLLDYSFSFAVAGRDADALQDWLSREHAVLRGKGRRIAHSHYSYPRTTRGVKPTSWVCALRDNPWISCTDGQYRRPGDVLLEPNPDYEDAPIADLDAGLAERLTEEGVRFGVAVSKSPALRRLAYRRISNMPDAELAEILSEALEQVAAGEATRRDLIYTLQGVKLRGDVPFDRLVQRTGAGTNVRSDLGGWVLSISDLHPQLATALQSLDLDLPATTTGTHALTFLRHTWEKRPERVDEMRKHFASAYRYVLHDARTDRALAKAWDEARDSAQLYGRRSWHPIGPDLAVDDVQSPLIRRFLPDKVIVASAHLGDTRDDLRHVARALGLSLLSEEVTVQRGCQTDALPCEESLLRLVQTLGSLEDRRSLEDILFCKELALRVGREDHAISAYIDDGELLLVGQPRSFAVEAAGQLVEYFQLNQRGSEVAWLTGALFALDDPKAFERNLRVLADGLGVTLPDSASEPSGVDREGNQVDSSQHGDSASGAGTETGEEPRQDNPPDGAEAGQVDPTTGDDTGGDGSSGPPSASSHGDSKRDGDESSDSGKESSTSKKRRSPGRRAADHFRPLLVRRSDRRRQEDLQPGQGGKKDDHKARKAVVEYETHRGRRARGMDDNQPGFDVLSEDPATGGRRFIEVKGVQGIFEEEASVVLTSRQVHDALQHDQDDVEYWLYVVDSTETERPRIFPIPWTRHRSHLRYGFYASAWIDDADQPAVASDSGLEELETPEPPEAKEGGGDRDTDAGWDAEGRGLGPDRRPDQVSATRFHA